jgi:beta-N-acetylhexosaminidase
MVSFENVKIRANHSMVTLDGLSLEEKIGQMLAVGYQELEPPQYLLDWLAEGRFGMVILFARNVDTPQQLARATKMLHDVARYPLLICIDQEGGSVARLREGFTESPGAMALGAADDEALAEQVSAILAEELRAVGINWNLAPAIDITHDTTQATMGTRSLGTDPARVSALAVAQVRGFQKAGVMATAKHFPGLGNTPTDTHVALAVISGSADYLWDRDLVPFRAAIAAGLDSVMINHVKFEALDKDYPSTLSKKIIKNLLREELGFSGIAVTDCFEMKAIADNYGVGESAVLAAQAGNDVILFSHTRAMQEEAHNAMLEAAQSGRISMDHINAANKRIAFAKVRYKIDSANLAPKSVRQPKNLAIMDQAARRGTVLLRAAESVFPLRQGMRVGLVEFASMLDSGIIEDGDLTCLAMALQHAYPNLESEAIRLSEATESKFENARRIAVESEVLILATRNANIHASQREFATELLSLSRNIILACLRNPFDVDVLPFVATVLCTCGDSTPSLQAAADALVGKFTPTGRLPVPLAGAMQA